ncbi:MAG: NADH-quinone oxidoreductase subunit C [Deltaproteobacteria bacterium]|nr:NADH-quinone oxidoreductase subunit C [Deltaproteobacteria bacterium]
MPEIDIKGLSDKAPAFLERFSGEVLSVSDFRGDLEICVKKDRLKEMVGFLKEDSSLSFDILMDLFGMDYSTFPIAQLERFAVVYNFYSVSRKKRLRLKVFVPEQAAELDSIHEIYKAANWYERETWDMFGIRFLGHPNLVRILCHGEFQGHPLRKDYPSDQYQKLKHAAHSNEI